MFIWLSICVRHALSTGYLLCLDQNIQNMEYNVYDYICTIYVSVSIIYFCVQCMVNIEICACAILIVIMCYLHINYGIQDCGEHFSSEIDILTCVFLQLYTLDQFIVLGYNITYVFSLIFCFVKCAIKRDGVASSMSAEKR